jgi:hypothetical protein
LAICLTPVSTEPLNHFDQKNKNSFLKQQSGVKSLTREGICV